MLELHHYAELLETALKKGKNIHKLTLALREHRFVFVTDHVIEKLKLPLKVEEAHHDFDFMIIQYPNSGQYDTFLAFGIKLTGKLSEEVHIYLNNHFYKTIKLELGKRRENFRKVKKRMIFPAELNYDQRALLRKEHLSLQAKRNIKLGKKPSEFYLKWWPKVVMIDNPK